MELARFPSRGGFSVRSIITFVLAVLTTVVFWAIFSGTPAHAADANWSGDSIVYAAHGYTKATDFKDATGTIPSGSTVYQSPVQTVDNTSTKKIFILYFTPGVDPPKATSAKYVEFNYTNAQTSNPQNQKDVPLTPKGQEDPQSSCSVSGVGWFVCPISVFLAQGMDTLFSILSSMIQVQPSVLGDQNNSMFVAWNIMRSIANVAFVIAFLIIIYSQLTNIGISNYGIKKLLPRLIIAAILVNLSYYVTALAIDVSNVLGFSVQQVFNGIRQNIFHLTNDNLGPTLTNPWGAVTTAILAGGGLVGGVYYAATGGLYLLIPLLLGLALTALFVVIVLAARQAIIVIMVIIAPLAFVANLLPNTEKWFTKWRELFMTMLIFFPAFSLVFGGSQLAGQIIMQNAGDNIFVLLFGMAVQIAPLVITPVLLKFSGSLLGRIAQIANNPRKGLIDRNRNWAQARADHAKQQNIARGARLRNPASWGAGMVRSQDFRKRRLNDRTEMWKQAATNRYNETPKYGKIHEEMAGVEIDKGRIHDDHTSHIEHLKVTPGSSLYERAQRAEASKDTAQGRQNDTAAYFNRQRTIAGTALNASSDYLERSKMQLESSENEKTIYQMNQKLTQGTLLNGAVDRLETSKLRVERKQSQYSAMVDSMKLDTTTGVHAANLGAASAKELQEAAQNRIQAYMDQQRRTAGTGLNRSTITLEETKLAADASKNLTTAYVNAEKLAVGSDLHLQVIRSEQAKLAGQVAETQVNKMVEEYKSGKIERTGELGTLMTSMTDNVEQLAAESQGVKAAQNMQTRNIAEAFTAGTDRAQELLRTAQSVDPYGDVRAEAGALATLDDILNKARTANESLIEERANASNKTPKNLALDLIKARLGGDMSQSEDLIRAAMEIAGKEAQIPIIRKMRQSHNFNQEHLSAMLLRNSGTMKTKGGFDLQNDTGLIYASDELMDASIAGTIGSTAAEQFKDLKNGAFISYAENMKNIIEHTEQMQNSNASDKATRDNERQYGENGMVGLQKTYFNLTLALTDPQMIRALGDNLIPAIDMHKSLHAKFQDPSVNVDYDKIDPRKITDHDTPVNPSDLGEGLGPDPES